MPRSSHPSLIKKHLGKSSSNLVSAGIIHSNIEAATDTEKGRKLPAARHHDELEAATHGEADPLSGAINYTAQAKSLVKDVLQPGEPGRLTADQILINYEGWFRLFGAMDH